MSSLIFGLILAVCVLQVTEAGPMKLSTSTQYTGPASREVANEITLRCSLTEPFEQFKFISLSDATHKITLAKFKRTPEQRYDAASLTVTGSKTCTSESDGCLQGETAFLQIVWSNYEPFVEDYAKVYRCNFYGIIYGQEVKLEEYVATETKRPDLYPDPNVDSDSLNFAVSAGYNANGKIRSLKARCSLTDPIWTLVDEVSITDTLRNETISITNSGQPVIPNDEDATVQSSMNCAADTQNDGCFTGEVAYLSIDWEKFEIENWDYEFRLFVCTVKGRKGNSCEQTESTQIVYRVNESPNFVVRESYHQEDEVQLYMRWFLDEHGSISTVLAKCTVNTQDRDVQEVIIYRTDDESTEYARFNDSGYIREESELGLKRFTSTLTCADDTCKPTAQLHWSNMDSVVSLGESTDTEIMQWSCKVIRSGQCPLVGDKWFRINNGRRYAENLQK